MGERGKGVHKGCENRGEVKGNLKRKGGAERKRESKDREEKLAEEKERERSVSNLFNSERLDLVAPFCLHFPITPRCQGCTKIHDSSVSQSLSGPNNLVVAVVKRVSFAHVLFCSLCSRS